MSGQITDKSNSKIEQSPALDKKKLLNTEISESESKAMSNVPIPEDYKGYKLFCRVWNETGTRTLGKPKKVPYGMPFFSAKVGGKMRYFKINYYTLGMIKNINGRMFYDTVFDNSTGGSALRNYEFPEDMNSEEAFTIFKNNAVNMYVKKGGISPMVLYICIAIIGITSMGLVIMGPYVINAMQQHDVDIKDLTSASGKIQALRNQVVALGEKPLG